ncbi:MAG: aldehyde ferredoxin oxidoreductase family protein [Chloroflexota bacterium]|nr:aldehyde ferredoxin oxidoreductase family protein [Chloroflexota bacterium]
MAGGYMGKMLWVDLSTGKMEDEPLDEKMCRDYIGGYGLAAKLIYDRQKPGVDALGPDNIFGFVTGPLTGTGALIGSRYMVVGKSPRTGGWGDANSGGFFGPNLKFAGYDAVFFKGISEKPVYLFIDNGKPELRDASNLWGKDAVQTEDALRAELGKKAEIACIGPSGEKLNLIAGVVNNKGRIAARSGLGAVMGSKKLKAVAVLGNMEVPVANKEKVSELRKEYTKAMEGHFADMMKNYGTCGLAAQSAAMGDSPIKNWAGAAGNIDFPNAANISDDQMINRQERKYACYRCPVGCGGHMKAGGNKFKIPAGSHKPEYETIAAFGSMVLNDDLDVLLLANDICNIYGIDSISAGTAVAFAMECYENGIITKADADGLELTWGNHDAIIALTEKIAKREGFGAVLADGVKVAAEKIGKGSEKYAMHVGGEEIPMHDPRLAPSFGTTYETDATPARHTQGGFGFGEMMPAAGLELEGLPPLEQYAYTGKAMVHGMMANSSHTMSAAGCCLFGSYVTPMDAVPNFLAAVTGWEFSMPDSLVVGERIANIRRAFNVREGIKPEDYKLPARIKGVPPLKEGPLAGVTIDVDNLSKELCEFMDWDLETGKPSKDKLVSLGMDDVAKDLWP